MTITPRASAASIALATALVALALAAPAASAEPIMRVNVYPGPHVELTDEPNAPPEHYYVTADAHDPEAPGAYAPERDCSVRDAATDPREPRDQPPIQSWRPVVPERGSLEGVTPECAWQDVTLWLCAVETCTGAVKVRAAYDMTTGDYAATASAEPYTRIPGVYLPGAPAFAVQGPAANGAASGNTGVGVDFDCEGCPTPP